ncbi:NADH dehydrogenase subunit 4L (mitochondrion) [Diaphorina citri]|uniref:NADH-ubiquinone oxidoreductase chain 4L n=1 Tax=Diaphorina citri TaxID=121845 RepID=A0A1X9QH14_DIACI|nr:NADH dehydrogenase subunit 4L [Diaphorina citri]ANC65509.1 NADH dehydrogenase subunit 4L [Diaphorina citri]AOW71073.1 NADH dehydrogenase subunit 4L [Diaphorina citri]ARQ27121.1 NADH dehydrogenase subunit 4L [Diaphorina citri]ARQ27134.1 NADH dehydrogenase subunit 4L [Diaphorina citri]ATD85660.1 NADH dehydrogenase subunit 4L [Diaphorina citri]
MSCLFMFYFGLSMFFMFKKHILMLLLTLEFLVLIILLMLVNFLMNYMFDDMILIYFIIVMVCEAVMGLVLLTLLVRSHGSDYAKSLLIFSC